MERRIPPLKHIILCVFLFTAGHLFAQEAQQDKQLRVELWAELDAYPGLEVKVENSVYDFALGRISEIAPFIMGAMINGWKFDYTPYDKVRSVQEYFSYEPVLPFDTTVNPLEFHHTEVIDNRLVCWVYCNRTPMQQHSFTAWKSIKHPKIRGIGQGEIADGFDGIKTAYENALKDAVRTYWRGISKNKPKEITGTVLLINEPRIYIQEGRYTVDLDFFMETGRMIPYSYY